MRTNKIFRLFGIILLPLLLLGFQPIDTTHSSKSGNSKIINNYIPVSYNSNNTTIYSDDFDGDNSVLGLNNRGYKVYNNSSPVGSSSWFQGNNSVFNAFNGPTTGYVAANYQTTSGTGNVDLWLISPKISGGIFSGDLLSFWTRSTDSSTTEYPDSIRVYLSPNGDSTINGTYTELGRFKVKRPVAGSPNNGYEQKIFQLLTFAPNGRIVIRYNVVNGGPTGINTDYIGIDALKIERGGSNLPLGTFNLTSPSNGVYTPSKPNFVWGISDNANFYKLFVDGILYKDSIYSTNYQLQQSNALSDITHTWNIQSYNLSGVRQSNQTWSILVDSTAPSAFDLISPSNNSWSNTYKPNLQWNPSIDSKSGLAKYQLWIDGILNRDNIAIGTTTIKPINNLSNGSHTWEVRAFDNVGNIRTSNQSWITKIDSVAPNFNTTDIILITPSNNQYLQSNLPNFTWRKANDAGVGFGKFQLFIDGNLNADNLSDTIFISTSPLNYGSHTWFIKAFDLLGNNKSSETGTFYIDNASPNPFNLLAPADSQIVNLPTPNFSWQGTLDSTGGSGLRKYQLIINGNVSIDSISPNVTTSSPGNALAQGVYSWYVKAYDNLGNIRYSTTTRTFYADWEPPTAFTTILPNNGDTSITKRPTFSWHKSNDIGSGLTKYELIISGQQIITVPVTDTVKQTTFDLPNGNYTWYVKAYDRAGSFTSSNVKSLTVASIPLPLTPTLFLPVNSSVNQPTDAFFKWGRPGEYARNTKENFNFDNQLSILKFWFELTTDTVSFSNGLRDTSVTDTVKSVLGLSNLTTYYWRVKAKNLYNYGPFSNWNKFSTTGISSFALNTGWNIFSVPLLSQDMSVSSIIPGASSQAFGYNNGYQQTSVLQNGKGYWIKYDSLRNFTVTGLPVTPRSINVLEGWNIIGPFETSVPVSSITSNPSGIIISNFFGFNNGYSNATTLAPGKGYWVKTSQSGSLILPSAPLASRDVTDSSKENENWISIKITDSKQNNSILYLGNNENVTGNYTLPPIGPSGVFDARFSSDNYVDIWKGSHVIKINTTEYPVKLKVENLKGKTLRIKDNVTGKLLDQVLTDGIEIAINLNLESIILTEEVLIPTTFDLSQNYPNPFNPITTIKYQIPKDEFVKIIVYDLLGREIKLLINDFKPAGYYDIKFDGSNLASGVYFYQINAGNYKNIKKMVVMK